MLDLAIDGRVFIENEIDAAIQELDLLFNTENTELIGYSDFGCSFEQFLWQTTDNSNAIKNYIYSKISQTLYLSTYRVDVEVNLINGEYRLIYQVQIKVYDKNNENEYKIRQYEFR
jgi:hypothetical protein